MFKFIKTIDMKKLILLMLVLFFSCKKTDNHSGKIEISVIHKTSVTISNGTDNLVDLMRWRLKEEIVSIPTNIINEYVWGGSTLLQKGKSITYSAATLTFTLATFSTISLYDSSGVLIATN
jgi:hypothetical protein